MVPLDLISARYDNPLLSSARTSASTGFTRLADSIADQYRSAFSGTPLAELYTDQGTLASALGNTAPRQANASGFTRQAAVAAYGTTTPSSSTSSPSSLAASIRQSALTAPLSLYGSQQPSLARSLDLLA